ncbi:hypothetical protein GQ42DRAFT_107989, partial [Ramicandelaber brevisporus]
IGILLCLVGGSVLNIGLNMQKKAYLNMDKLAAEKKNLPLGNMVWLTGFVVFILGNVANFTALQFAPQSLVAPLGAISLVTNVIVAPWLNGERLSRWDIGGIVLIIGGCVIAVVFSGVVSIDYRLCVLINLLKATATVVYLCIIGSCVIAIWLIRFALPLAYASLGGLMATLTTLFAKSLINLLAVSITQGKNQFTSFLAWVILIVTVTTAVSQVFWINMGLRRYDALLQVPVFYVVWTVFDIIGGGIYYDEFAGFTATKAVVFSLGVLIIFAGVGIL